MARYLVVKRGQTVCFPCEHHARSDSIICQLSTRNHMANAERECYTQCEYGTYLHIGSTAWGGSRSTLHRTMEPHAMSVPHIAYKAIARYARSVPDSRSIFSH
eukprot:658909-Rhodomonas_salina.3